MSIDKSLIASTMLLFPVPDGPCSRYPRLYEMPIDLYHFSPSRNARTSSTSSFLTWCYESIARFALLLPSVPLRSLPLSG